MTLKHFPPAERTWEIQDDSQPKGPKSVLLIEDDADLCDTLQGVLEGVGFKVSIAKDGVEGLRHVMGADFDAVVCDLLMPNLPGDMFYLAVERTKPHLCKRFLFVTGHGHDPKIAAFLKKTHALTLYKPFQISDFLDHVRAACGK